MGAIDARRVLFGLLCLTAFGACEEPPDDGLVVDTVENPFVETESDVSGAMPTPLRACVNVSNFSTYAAPLLSKYCVACHNGTKYEATELLDLQTLADHSLDGQQYACDATLSTTNETDPLASNIFQFVDPASGITHDFKFPTSDSFAIFQQSIMTWLGSE